VLVSERHLREESALINPWREFSGQMFLWTG